MTSLTQLGIRTKVVITATLATLGAAGGIAAPAWAGNNCPGGHHCVFYVDFNSAKHEFFNSDHDFADDLFDKGGSHGRGQVVTNNVWAASNSSTGGYYSLYYYSPYEFGGLVFCVKPGSQVSANQLSTNSIPGDDIGQRDEASSLELRRTGWIPGGCF